MQYLRSTTLIGVSLINWAERRVSLISWAILSCAIQSRFSASLPWWRHLRKSQFTLFCPHIPSPGSLSSLCISSSHDEGLVWQKAMLNLSSGLHMYYFHSSILLLLFRNSSHCLFQENDFDLGLYPMWVKIFSHVFSVTLCII